MGYTFQNVDICISYQCGLFTYKTSVFVVSFKVFAFSGLIFSFSFSWWHILVFACGIPDLQVFTFFGKVRFKPIFSHIS